MADTVTTQDPELQNIEPDQTGDNQQNNKLNANEVKIREPFEIGGISHIIYDIEVDKKGKKTANWRIKEGSQVEIYGSGLEIYDQINLHIAGGVYLQKNIDRQAGGRILSFTVSDEIKDLFAEGKEIELEFVSNANSANNRYLKQKFYYKGESAEEKAAAKKKQAEEQELKQAKAGQGSPGAVSEIINRSIGGTAEPFGQGLAGKPEDKSKATADSGKAPATKVETSKVGDNGQTYDDFDDDEQELGDVSGQQIAEELASTVGQSSVGAEVISQGSTAQGSVVGTQTISAGGTVTGAESISSRRSLKTSGAISGGGTATISQPVQAGGTISGTQKTSVSGTATGGESDAKISQTVSGSKTVAGSEKVSATQTSTTSQTSSGGTATGPAIQKTQSEVSVSQKDQSASESGATSQGTATVVGQGTTEVKTETAAQGQTKVEGQAPTGGSGVQEKVSAQENIETESKTSVEPNKAEEDSGKEKISTEVKQTATQKNQPSSKAPESPTAGKGKIDGVEKKSETESPEKSPAQKKSGLASTAGFSGGFGATGGALPTQLGNLSGTLNRFKANEAALGSRLGSSGGKQPLATQKQSGPGQNILDNTPQRAPGEKDKAGDAEKEKSDGKIAEQDQEKPLASPMGAPLPQEDVGEGDSQESSKEQNKPTPPGKEKSEQEENPEQESTGGEVGPEAEQEQEANQQAPIIQKAALPQALGAGELAEAEKLVNTTVNGYLQSLAIIIWSSALPTFGLSILFGALAGDFLWLLKDWAIKKALSKTPLPKKFRQANVKDFHINFSLSIKTQIAVWNALVIATAIFIFIFIFTILWGICNSWVTYPIRETGLKPVCEAIDKSSLGQGLSNFQSTGSFTASYNTPGTLISTAQWTDQINSSAQKWNIDACILRVVVQKESGGNQGAIGCDCAANGNPQFCPDKRKTYSSDYQFNWNQCSYGIGLTQWTIYPKGGGGYKSWQDANTPSRNLYSAWYGVPDFLDGRTSLDLTAKAFSANLGKANGDIAAAFGTYVGASNVQSRLVADRMALYNLCKNGN